MKKVTKQDPRGDINPLQTDNLQKTTQVIRNLNKNAPSYRSELVTILKQYGKQIIWKGYMRGLEDARKAIDNVRKNK